MQTRELTSGDHQDRLGRLSIMLLNGAHWDMPVTETPLLDSTEVWSFINLTDDSHPIHLHMVRFQILERRPFDLSVYQLTRKIVFTGPATPLPPRGAGLERYCPGGSVDGDTDYREIRRICGTLRVALSYARA